MEKIHVCRKARDPNARMLSGLSPPHLYLLLACASVVGGAISATSKSSKGTMMISSAGSLEGPGADLTLSYLRSCNP